MGLALRVEEVEVVEAAPLALADAGGQRPSCSPDGARGGLVLGLILGLLQILDGIFTSMGVQRFGIKMEGNPLLRALMVEFGHLETLAVVKFLALFVVAFLAINAKRFQWVRSAMGLVATVYVFAAILPWAYILFIEPMV